ncbi:unnamed protein product [Chrysoparadoxa australica]
MAQVKTPMNISCAPTAPPGAPPGTVRQSQAANGTASGLAGREAAAKGEPTFAPPAKRKPGGPENSKNKALKTDDWVETSYPRRPPSDLPQRVGNKRRRAAPVRFVDEDESKEEMILIQQAIENSRKDQFVVDVDKETIPDAPTYYPTLEEFKDPLAYVEKIRPQAETYGVVKIQPPQGWDPPEIDSPKRLTQKFPTKRQAVHTLTEGQGFEEGGPYTYQEYAKFAAKFARNWRVCFVAFTGLVAAGTASIFSTLFPVLFGRVPTDDELEREYWRIVNTRATEATVEYGNDLDVKEYWSCFPRDPGEAIKGPQDFNPSADIDLSDPEYYKSSGWNLNNLPFWPGSVLRFHQSRIAGVNSPWLYLGMQFSTFAWHNEDSFLYSINYHHKGAPKQWYGVPGDKAQAFEKVLQARMRQTMAEEPDLLYHITTMISPFTLKSNKVPVYRAKQEAGQFVVTFPKSYHGGFSYGFNCGEAVNFGPPEWLKFGRQSKEAYRRYRRAGVFGFDRMAFTLAMYVPELGLKAGKVVLEELKRLRDEELSWRSELLLEGVRDLSDSMVLPKFKLSVIEEKASDYDDQRMCKTCNHTCFISGVSCTCTRTEISCLRHYRDLCQCDIDQRYLLVWMSENEINRIVDKVQEYVSKLEKGEPIDEEVRVNVLLLHLHACPGTGRWTLCFVNAACATPSSLP